MNKTHTSLLILTLFILPNTIIAQSLRDVVPIVRPVYGEPSVKFLNDFGVYLDKKGYDSLGVQMKNYANGTNFGSGFAYTDKKDNRTFILTNAHVLEQAKTANVEFALEDLSTKSYNNCQIVATDQAKDIAIIALPEGATIPSTLQFSTEKAIEGDDVFTAGHPGLGNKPSWQLGKGIVSNSNMQLNEFNIKGNFIQHTAQIDPGSSGGPLLKKNSDAPRGFEVLGINSLKVSDRENANFAIPAKQVQIILENYCNSTKILNKEMLLKKANDLIEIKNDGFLKVLPFVSYDFVEQISPESFLTCWGKASENVSKAVSKSFKNFYPVEAVRIILADEINKVVANKEMTISSLENVTDNGTATVIFNIGNAKTPSTWIAEQGEWRLSRLESVKIKNPNKRLFAKYNEYMRSFSVVANYLTNSKGSFYEVLFGTTINTYYNLQAGFVFGNPTLTSTDESDNSITNYNCKTMGITTQVGIQLPLRVNQFLVTPYAKLIGGIEDNKWGDDFFDDDMFLTGGSRVGVELSYEIYTDTYATFGLGYRTKTYVTLSSMSFDPIKCISAYFALSF